MSATQKLTGRQELFVAEYLKDLRPTLAAKRAGYTDSAASGYQLMQSEQVREAIAAAHEARNARLHIDADQVLREVLNIAMVDLVSITNPDGTLMPLHEMPAEARRAISSLEIEQLFGGPRGARAQIGTITKVKLWSKDKHLELLLRHLGLLRDKLDVTVTDTLAQKIRDGRKRVGS